MRRLTDLMAHEASESIDLAAETTGERINRLEQLARAHRAQHAEKLDAGEASPAELAAIVKLEVSVANLRAFEELRELTAG